MVGSLADHSVTACLLSQVCIKIRTLHRCGCFFFALLFSVILSLVTTLITLVCAQGKGVGQREKDTDETECEGSEFLDLTVSSPCKPVLKFRSLGASQDVTDILQFSSVESPPKVLSPARTRSSLVRTCAP